MSNNTYILIEYDDNVKVQSEKKIPEIVHIVQIKSIWRSKQYRHKAVSAFLAKLRFWYQNTLENLGLISDTKPSAVNFYNGGGGYSCYRLLPS